MHRLVKMLPLTARQKPAQLARFSDDGALLVIIGDEEPV